MSGPDVFLYKDRGTSCIEMRKKSCKKYEIWFILNPLERYISYHLYVPKIQIKSEKKQDMLKNWI